MTILPVADARELFVWRPTGLGAGAVAAASGSSSLHELEKLDEDLLREVARVSNL